MRPPGCGMASRISSTAWRGISMTWPTCRPCSAARLRVWRCSTASTGTGALAAARRISVFQRSLGRSRGRLDVAGLDRGADHVERRERQDQGEAAAPAGLAEGEVHAEDHDVDVVGREAELREALAQVADREALGQRPAEVGADGVGEGGEDGVEVQPAERHVDGGEGARQRRRGLHRVAAEGEVDEVVGEIGLERDEPGRVGVLDVDERRASAGPVIAAVASASLATRAAPTVVPITVLTRRRMRSSTPRAKVSPRSSVSASGERATPPWRSFCDRTLPEGGIAAGLARGDRRAVSAAILAKV